jgi:hypothetical protein
MKSFGIFLLTLGLGLGYWVQAQVLSYPFIGKQFSSTYASGSARMLALGGTHQAIGADISSIAGNAAGLGYYNRSEINITGGFGVTSVGSNYIGMETSRTESQFGLTGFGIVLAGEDWRDSDWKGNLGISYSKQLMFNQSFSVVGLNNVSSLLDKYIQTVNKNGETGTSLDNQYDYNSNTALSQEALAYQSYLINPDAKTGGAPFSRFEPSLPTQQAGYSSAEGFQSQWDFSYGLGYRQKFYVGAGLHFTKIQSTLTSTWDETFVGARYVSGFSFDEKLLTAGTGYSLSLGMIYKLNNQLRAGFNFQTPTYYSQVNEQLTGGMNSRAIAIPSYDSNGNPINISKVGRVNLATNEFTYQLTTPMKIGGGLAYFFGKKGFLTLDVEMIDYSKISVSSEELSSSANQQFKDKYNSTSQKYFQADLNLKFGAEIRLSPHVSARAGIATFGSGYQKTFDAIDRSVLQLSGGFGYKSDTFYVDFSVVNRSQKDAYTPYTLDNASKFASSTLVLKNTTVSLTGGIYF